jgi:hypothetical protein
MRVFSIANEYATSVWVMTDPWPGLHAPEAIHQQLFPQMPVENIVFSTAGVV